MFPLIPYPFLLPYVFLLLSSCKPKINHDFMNPVMPYVLLIVPINHSFKCVSRYSILPISFLNNIYFPLFNHLYRMSCFLPYIWNLICFFVYLFYLINSSNRYTGYFPSLIGCSTII